MLTAARYPWMPVLLALASSMLFGCDLPSIAVCESSDGVTPVCEFGEAEDVVRLSAGPWILVSEGVGRISAYHPDEGEVMRLYVPDSVLEPVSPIAGSDCGAPPTAATFKPLGMTVTQAADGARQLLVVNNSKQRTDTLASAIEFFAIDADEEELALEWEGCLRMPAGINPNDLVVARDGRIFVTHMARYVEGPGVILTGLQSLLGYATGHVMVFREKRWSRLDGTAIDLPNGIALGADDSMLFVASSGDRQLVSVDLNSGRRAHLAVPHLPDNLTWMSEKKERLWSAGIIGRGFTFQRCDRQHDCVAPWSVVETDTSTFAASGQKVVFCHDGSALGFASAVVPLESGILVGSAKGTRIGVGDTLGKAC